MSPTPPMPDSATRKRRKDPSTQDRAREYKDWHYTLHPSLVAYDVDLVEWRLRPTDTAGEPNRWVPVATKEITAVPAGITHIESYLASILSRYAHELQGRVAQEVAWRLNVPCYIVAFEEGLANFWVYELTSPSPRWRHLTQPQYVQWLSLL